MTEQPDSPYKGLAAFADSPLDALLFFGRERERETIVANTLASELTVLYGPSGVGKSSLLRAGVAQELRRHGSGTVVVHDSWADDPVPSLISSIADASGGLGPTAGLVDTVAAAAQTSGEVFLLLDQFEEYFLYHDADGPLVEELPELLRRPGLRVTVLIALRDDALSELDAFTDSVPGLFANMLRLDRLDREAGRAAIVGPLERYSDLVGRQYVAEPALVEAVLDEVAVGRVDFSGTSEIESSREQVEAPFLQLVLERLWAEEEAADSNELRLETFHRLGGAEPIVREHVQGALQRLPAAEQAGAARVVRQLVTSSGTKIAHTATDLAEYADIDAAELQPLLETLVRERIVRGVDGAGDRPTRYEIFHDVLAAPVLNWRVGYELERERLAARRQRRRLRSIVAATLVALLVVGAIAVFALIQRSDARTQAQRAHGRELAADALAGIPTDPANSLSLALRAAGLAPGPQTEDVLRSTLLAMREQRVLSIGGNVVGASFTPRGHRLVVASSNGTIGLYDANGLRLADLPKQPALTHVGWSPDGRFFATGDANGTVTIWRASDGGSIRTIRSSAPIAALAFAKHTILIGSGGHLLVLDGVRGHVHTIRIAGAVVAAALSPNARLIAFAAERKNRITAKVFDTTTRMVRFALPERGIGSLTFSADGLLLATGSSDKTARLWSTANGRLVRVLPMRGHVLSERFSPDGRSLVTAGTDGTAAIWNVPSGARELLLVGATGNAEDAAFSPDGKEVAVAFADRLARIYSTQDGRLLAPLAGHTDAVTSVGFDPSGTVIVTGSADGTARLWQANPTGALATIDQRHTATHTLFAGPRVLSIAGDQARILTTSGNLISALTMNSAIAVAASSGTSLALADARGDLDLATLGGSARTIQHLRIAALAYTPHGELITGSRDGTARIWLGQNAAPRLVRTGSAVTEIAAASQKFAALDASGTVRVYSLDGHALASIDAHAQHVAISQDGRIVATTHAREADLWDGQTGTLLHRLSGHRSLVTDAEFSPDGSLLVTASDDHDGRVWDARTGSLRHVLRGHFFPVRSASFSSSNRWIVTASQFTGGLWDARTGELILYLQGHTKPLTSASFSPDGDWIVTGSDDGTAGIFRCDVCRDLAGLKQTANSRLESTR
jgi:WD40 repeat protein